MLLLLAPQTGLPLDIPVNATVLNSPPEVLDLTVQEGSVDPDSPFHIRVSVRDNNTLSDIRALRIMMFKTDQTGAPHEISWDGEGFRALGGKVEVLPQECETPSNLKGSEGDWVFAVRLPGDAPYGSWKISAQASDEANTSTVSSLFWVNNFISVTLAEPGKLDFSLPPGSVGDGSETHIRLIYTSNRKVQLLARATPFVGAEDSSFKVPASAFEIALEGFGSVRLSDQDTKVASELPPGKDVPLELHLRVHIPQPFYDQDYEGLITIILRS